MYILKKMFNDYNIKLPRILHIIVTNNSTLFTSGSSDDIKYTVTIKLCKIF